MEMEMETCENVYKIPHYFQCNGGCCGTKPEQYCCFGMDTINLTLFTLCSALIFVLCVMWILKKWCTNERRYGTFESERNGSQRFSTNLVALTTKENGSVTRQYHPVSYQLRPLPSRERLPTYEEAIRS